MKVKQTKWMMVRAGFQRDFGPFKATVQNYEGDAALRDGEWMARLSSKKGAWNVAAKKWGTFSAAMRHCESEALNIYKEIGLKIGRKS